MSAAFTGASLVYDHNNIEDQISDYAVTAHADNALNSDAQLAALHSVSITTFNRIILITGQVPSIDDYQHIDDLVKNTTGAIKVFNAVEIGKPLPPLTIAQDAWITTKIKTQIIAAHGINPSKVKVITDDGIVYLMGTVTKQQAQMITNIAKQSSGVKKIIEIFNYVIIT